MSSSILLYRSNGFVGDAIARQAVGLGLRPILVGRNAPEIEAQANDMGLEHRIFDLKDATALDSALNEVSVVLHYAGPYIYTYKPMVDACLRSGTHYLDITGEIPVYEAVSARDAEAQTNGVMLLPGVGFDVVATDCLAVHLKNRLPFATHLRFAFFSKGPAGLPPGTANTMVETLPHGTRYRRDGKLVQAPRGGRTRMIDFSTGEVRAILLSWGDVFMAFHSTGIPNIEVYAVFPESLIRTARTLNSIRPLFRLAPVRSLIKRMMPSGSTHEQRARTFTSVWGEVEDDQGRKAVSRLHGPDAGVT